MGVPALGANLHTSLNTAVGSGALANATAGFNTALGNGASSAVTWAHDVIAIGHPGQATVTELTSTVVKKSYDRESARRDSSGHCAPKRASRANPESERSG